MAKILAFPSKGWLGNEKGDLLCPVSHKKWVKKLDAWAASKQIKVAQASIFSQGSFNKIEYKKFFGVGNFKKRLSVL